jgi:hypothetical protein
MGWRNASFRGYADYMQTSTFTKTLNCCIAFAKQERVVLMCAEAVPWRCHRSLIADALLVRGIKVSEISTGVRTRPHSLTPWARRTGTRLTYPAAVARARQSAPARARLIGGRDDQSLNAREMSHVAQPEGPAGRRAPRDRRGHWKGG